MVDYASPQKHGNQKGKFIGNPAGVHIHIVKNNDHVKIGNYRKDFDDSKKKSLQAALDQLIERSNEKVEGYSNCKTWLEEAIKDAK